MLAVTELKPIGSGLSRPECVLTTASGHLYTSYLGPEGRSGVSHIAPNGAVVHYTAKDPRQNPKDFMSNGIALLRDGSFLIANLGPTGGVYHLDRQGQLSPKILEADGLTLPPTNFVGIDPKERIWTTVSTLMNPRDPAMRKGHADGIVVLCDARGTRIVAEGMGFTNEAIVDPSGEWLYVNETISRRTSRLKIKENGDLGPRETVTEYGEAVFPDGFNFDAEGGIWAVSVCSNRIIHTDRQGHQRLYFEDCDRDEMAQAEAHYQSEQPIRSIFDYGKARTGRNLASIAFGGADLRTLYMGTLHSDQVLTLPADITGAKPVHWHF